MKRAARHFGEKLGNSLYHDGFNANNAPPTLKDALDKLDIDRAKSRFGFDKDRKVAGQNSAVVQSKASNIKQEQAKKTPSNHAPTSAKPSYAQQQTPRTQYVGNVVMSHSNVSTQPKANANPSHVTPHHGAGAGNNAARNANTAAASSASNQNAAKSTTYVTPGNRTATSAKKSSTFDASMFAAVPAEKLQMGNNGKENSNPQGNPAKVGLALPPRPGTSALPSRPGTSRGGHSPTSAYIANFSEGNNATPSMFGANGTMSQALAMGQQGQTSSIAQSLKRKSDSMDASSAGSGSVAMSANTAARNPYSC